MTRGGLTVPFARQAECVAVGGEAGTARALEM